jgi:DNA-nicking Smr family endonuclease
VKPPRGLTAEEAAAWTHLSDTVKPFHPPRRVPGEQAKRAADEPSPASTAAIAANRPAPQRPPPSAPPRAPARASQDLDSHWDRRFRSGSIEPDFTLDLHGHTLDQAHDRLIDGIAQARAMGARVVLLIAGKSRPVSAADRGSRRGAIRANVLDWLAASSHGSAIASIRKAHIRHGGEGALYVVLKRGR